jgi:hypothetical protein
MSARPAARSDAAAGGQNSKDWFSQRLGQGLKDLGYVEGRNIVVEYR